MSTGSPDYKAFFSTLENLTEDGFQGKFYKYADYLSIAKIEDTFFFNGQPVSRNIDYFSDNAGTDCFEVTSGSEPLSFVVIKFTYKQFPPEFTPEQQQFMTIFKNSVISKITVERLCSHCAYLFNNDVDFGMLNHQYMISVLGKMIATGVAKQYSAAFINIKNVNQLNKFFGPEIGGTSIKLFGAKLNTFPDTSNQEFAVHLGGDNFAAVFRSSRLAEFEQFIREVPVTIAYGGDRFEHIFNCRVGIATITPNHNHGGQILSECSQAYYFGKQNGIDIVYYSEDINEQSHNNTETLNRALNENKFLIYYQPVVNIDGSPSLHAAEALARWPLNGKIISPQEFITLATDSGIVTKIDFYVLENVCRKIKAWQSLGLDLVPITVNFSGRNLYNAAIANDILDVIDKYGVEHRLIGIEFSEPDFTQRMPILKDVSHTLTEAGILVTLDKFSTGQSTLTFLHDIDASYLKINADRFAIDDSKGRVIADDMINLANTLGYKVICEGVETQKQADELASCGCTLFQSFLYDKPLSERFFLNRLENPNYSLEETESFTGDNKQ